MKKKLFVCIGMWVLAGSLVACSSEEMEGGGSGTGGNDEAEVGKEPATVVMGFPQDEGYFDEHFREHIEEALPHITVEHVISDTWDYDRLEEQVAQGFTPDILWVSLNHQIPRLIDFDLTYDLTDMIEASDSIDLNEFRENTIEGASIHSRDGELNVLPLHTGAYTLVYNKDIFDLFGEPYPTDGMTYEEILEIAGRLTRSEGGNVYRGLDLGWAHTNLFEFDFEFVDEDLVPQYTIDPQFRIGFELLEEYLNIPGIFDGIDGDTLHSNEHHFLEERNVAMQINYNLIPRLAEMGDEIGMDWDTVTFPKLSEDSELLYPMDHSPRLAITSVAEDKEAAFEVIEYLLSPEYQAYMASRGIVPAIEHPDVIAEYGSTFDGLEDKNIEIAIFEPKHAIGPTNMSPVTAGLNDIMIETINEFVHEGKDINSVLREADEKAITSIEENKVRLNW